MIEMTKKELAQLVGYTERQLYNIDSELPDEGKLFVRGANGKYLPDVFVKRWVEYREQRARENDSDLDALKAIHEEVKIERSRVELDKIRGALVDAHEAESAWINAGTRVRQRMMEIPLRIAPKLAGVDSEEKVADILSEEIRAALTTLSQSTPVSDEEEADDDGQ